METGCNRRSERLLCAGGRPGAEPGQGAKGSGRAPEGPAGWRHLEKSNLGEGLPLQVNAHTTFPQEGGRSQSMTDRRGGLCSLLSYTRQLPQEQLQEIEAHDIEELNLTQIDRD